MIVQEETYSDNGGDSDEDFDWEEVEVPVQAQGPNLSLSLEDAEQQHKHYLEDLEEAPSQPPRKNIEITIHTKKKDDTAAKERAAAIAAQRIARLNCHKIHTITLMANARVRNKWLNDDLLHARLMSITPMALQTSFAMITKSKFPDAARRGQLFEAAIERLAKWWSESFQILETGHIKSRPYEEVQKELEDKGLIPKKNDPKGKGKARAIEIDDFDEDDGEVIRSEKSLMKRALIRRGTRDVSAQLFTALCRALGIPARLVVSLQSVPWQAGVGKPKASTKKKAVVKGKGKQKAEGEGEDEDDMEMEEVDIPQSPPAKGKGKATPMRESSSTPSPNAKGKQKAPPVIKLRKSKGPQTASSSPTPIRQVSPHPLETPPVFWTEVFSKADARWLPVDPIRCIVNKRKAFDPTPSPTAGKLARNVKIENRMVYVLAFEEDDYARDVTPRYAREFGAKVAKMQQGGKGRQQWWECILGLVHRPFRLNRDDLEDEELHINQMTESMPTTMGGFKDHPLYVLARHLKQNEVIHPLVELGKFRGEPVYSRSSVIQLKTAETWMRQGRKIKEGCQPMKWVKQRAVTVNKKRAIEMAMGGRDDLDVAGEKKDGFSNEKDSMQGMYAESQTELYQPLPIIDGKIPKNDFGNIDLYVPTMLPAGGAYIPYKGAAKIARQLGFDFAEAVTGFEFKKRRAFPVITGIVVAAENESAILEAFWESEKEAEEKRRAKRHEHVIKRWTRLIHGLRIRQRLQEQYASKDANAAETRAAPGDEEDPEAKHEGGGFITGVDDVVQPYTLPRNLHEVPQSPIPSIFNTPGEEVTKVASEKLQAMASQPPALTFEEIQDSEDEDMLEVNVPLPAERIKSNGAPKTMQELAEEMQQQQDEENSSAVVDTAEVSELKKPSSSPAPTNGRVKTRPLTSSRGKTKNTVNRPVASTRSDTSTTSQKPGPKKTKKRNRGESVSPEPNGDGQEVDAGDDEVVEVPPPSKRAKRVRPPAPPVQTDRVLRNRTPKSAAKLKEEQEAEARYRRAVAQ
ncbi:transglutaminase-like superfamily protein [Abortiporus biennis]